MARRRHGFTLIELMIVVAIIGILASVAVPRFATLIRKSREGATKGNLAGLRSALTIYYSDLEGNYPDDLTSLTLSGKYINAIPQAKTPDYHPDASAVANGTGLGMTDAGGWLYDNLLTDANIGTVWVNCTHTDTKGSVWTAY